MARKAKPELINLRYKGTLATTAAVSGGDEVVSVIIGRCDDEGKKYPANSGESKYRGINTSNVLILTGDEAVQWQERVMAEGHQADADVIDIGLGVDDDEESLEA